MKRIILLLLVAMLTVSGVAGAQAPPDTSPESRAAMKKLAFLIGSWQGDGIVMTGANAYTDVTQNEEVESRLDGTVLLVEGIGHNKMNEKNVVHHAFAVMSYDVAAKKYEINAYLATGGHVVAEGKFKEDGNFEWGFTRMGRSMRYTISYVNDTWFEVGEYSMDGTTWTKFIEMQLKKKS